MSPHKRGPLKKLYRVMPGPCLLFMINLQSTLFQGSWIVVAIKMLMGLDIFGLHVHDTYENFAKNNSIGHSLSLPK